MVLEKCFLVEITFPLWKDQKSSKRSKHTNSSEISYFNELARCRVLSHLWCVCSSAWDEAGGEAAIGRRQKHQVAWFLNPCRMLFIAGLKGFLVMEKQLALLWWAFASFGCWCVGEPKSNPFALEAKFYQPPPNHLKYMTVSSGAQARGQGHTSRQWFLQQPQMSKSICAQSIIIHTTQGCTSIGYP